MNSNRAPKQWSLTEIETITTFEAWRQNLQYSLSLDANFAPFLADTFTWLKKSSTAPNRGLKPDGNDVPTTRRRTVFQKNLHHELMLDQIANFCPVISRSSIVKNSTSISSIWQAIRAHYSFQATGAGFLEFSNIKLEVDECPEDLFQRLMSLTEDNLLVANGSVTHFGAHVTSDEELTPTLENMVVLTWLKLLHSDLSALVTQRYGTELRSKTLAPLKLEISRKFAVSPTPQSRGSDSHRLALRPSLLPSYGLLPSDQSRVHFANRPVVMTNTSSALVLIYLQRTVLFCLGLA